MASKTLLLLVAPFLLLSLSSAHNITLILQNYPQFSAFNNLLTQTHIAAQINHRAGITVLAIDDSAIGGFQGLDPDTLKNFLSIHVLLDYYDIMKLQKMVGSVTLTTLFQTSGIADGRKGFVNMTKLPKEHRIAFRSSMPGAPFTANFVKQVVAHPYNISVLQVSSVIMTRDIDNMNFTVAPPPPKAREAPAPVEAEVLVEEEAPVEADAPVADGPESDAPAPGPAADAPQESQPVADQEAEAPNGSSAGRVAFGAGVGIAMSTVAGILLGL